MKKMIYFTLLFSLLISNCQKSSSNEIFQVSTIDALLAGVFDGDVSGMNLLKEGNFGIGTFDDLDGEMIVLNDTIFQVKADGKVYQPDLEIETPFASVCNFKTDTTVTISETMSLNTTEKRLDKILPNKNLFYAIRIKGDFSYMHTRSVPNQDKPYPPLKKVTKNQPEFRMDKISGTILGFWCPTYVKGINVPGYHLHFISNERNRGGHILDFEIVKGQVAIDIIDKFTLQLPSDNEFGKTDLSQDRSRELEKVEKK